MSHFLTIPINENGVIADSNLSLEISTAASAPFAFTDVFIYSHGWWNTASSAAAEYNIFSIGFSKIMQNLARQRPAICPRFAAPFSPLALAVHWPSMLSEDQDSVKNFLEATSFFTMQQRADSVGQHGGYSILRLLLQSWTAPQPLRFNLIGHSFGCRVLLSALQELAIDTELLSKTAGCAFNVVLLQAAADTDSLASDQLYRDVLGKIPNLRILVTISREDKALGTWYPAAQRIAHLFSGPIDAMGSVGPTKTAPIVFAPVLVAAGVVPAVTGPFIVADLTPLHISHAEAYGADRNWGGQHSDINLPEIYELLAKFVGK
jgi:Alpha/beta hydrolase of unknown function (DUF900)